MREGEKRGDSGRKGYKGNERRGEEKKTEGKGLI